MTEGVTHDRTNAAGHPHLLWSRICNNSVFTVITSAQALQQTLRLRCLPRPEAGSNDKEAPGCFFLNRVRLRAAKRTVLPIGMLKVLREFENYLIGSANRPTMKFALGGPKLPGCRTPLSLQQHHGPWVGLPL